MSFKDLSKTQPAVAAVLQRSLANQRLAHALLFSGDGIEDMELAARELAKAVNCESPRKDGGCDRCESCRKIDASTPPGGLHPDVQWIRPESKSRRIDIEQMRELEKTLHLKPALGGVKVGILVEADRLVHAAANAFLKTLEEPPDRSLILLLSTEPQQLLETVRSRCQRLQFGASTPREPNPAHAAVVEGLLALLGAGGSVLAAYRLLGVIRAFLDGEKKRIEPEIEQRLQLERYRDVADKEWKEKMEDEMAAQVEAEYRRSRAALVVTMDWLLRDLLMCVQGGDGAKRLFHRDRRDALRGLAAKLTLERALDNLAAIEDLHDQIERNVNESLALEMTLLRLSGLAPARALA
ncbi:MAG: DNA polymerase III subunit [Verrucomicrobiae bacterium]|nr:DNA polymerase III subunit [Verrucomicrobiae bacterium]